MNEKTGYSGLVLGFFAGFVAFGFLAVYLEDNQRYNQQDAINDFIEALERENCQVSRLPIWQLKIENLSANETVLVNTDNIRVGNVTFMSNKGVDSIKIPGGNYPYLDAVREMRNAVQTRGGKDGRLDLRVCHIEFGNFKDYYH